MESISIGEGYRLNAERDGVPLPVRLAPGVGNGLTTFMPAYEAIFHAVAVIRRQHELDWLRKRGKAARPTKEARQSKILYPTNVPALHAALRFPFRSKCH